MALPLNLEETVTKRSVLQFLRRMCTDEHMGDVCDTVQAYLNELSIPIRFWEMSELREKIDELFEQWPYL